MENVNNGMDTPMKYMLYSFFSILVFLVSQNTSAEAKSCEKRHVSIEKAFIDSDMIFSGVSSNRGIGVLDITEFFKVSDEYKNIKSIHVTGGWGKPINPKNKDEYLIYAKPYISKDGILTASVDTCGRSKKSTEFQISQFLQKKDNRKELGEFTHESTDLVLKGKVVKLIHEKDNRAQFDYQSISEVMFEIEEIYKNNLDHSFEAGGIVTIPRTKCGQGFDMGGSYLLEVGVSKHANKGEKNGENIHDLFCKIQDSKPVNEKEVLRKLGNKK